MFWWVPQLQEQFQRFLNSRDDFIDNFYRMALRGKNWSGLKINPNALPSLTSSASKAKDILSYIKIMQMHDWIYESKAKHVEGEKRLALATKLHTPVRPFMKEFCETLDHRSSQVRAAAQFKRLLPPPHLPQKIYVRSRSSVTVVEENLWNCQDMIYITQGRHWVSRVYDCVY